METKLLSELINLRTIGIERFIYKPYSIDSAMRVFKIIGEKKFGQFDIDSDNEWVIKNLIKWAHGDEMDCLDAQTKKVISGDTSKGIYIAGPT